MENFKAKFTRGGFFSPFMTEEDPRSFIIRSHQEMQNHVDDIMAEFRKDDAEVPKGHWEQMEAQVREFYSEFDQDFFKKNFLVIALVAQGSGSFRYELDSLNLNNGVLSIEISHNKPMIQTMDWVSTTLLLQLPSSEYAVDSVVTNVVS